MPKPNDVMTAFPEIVRVKQTFDRPTVDDIDARVRRELATLNLAQLVRQGDSIAVTAGSRGITNIESILRSVVDYLRSIGGEPFLVPAMGSHGGGTAQGQIAVLNSLGVSQETMGCPIRASMETVVLGTTDDGIPLHFDRLASNADHVFVCGRVKPHTRFDGPFQSGLLKMMLTGLGKCEGAAVYHRAFNTHGFDHVIRTACPILLKQASIVGGLAILENAYGETAQLSGVAPQDFEDRQAELLVQSKEWMARLPFDRFDILLVDQIGKKFSGTGMDTNIIGRKHDDHAAIPGETPAISKIVVRGVVGENAIGIGIAEYCTSKAVGETDLEATQLNGVTATHESAAVMPPEYATDRQALAAALQATGLGTDARIVWIKNTKELDHFACSTPCVEELKHLEHIEIVGPPTPLPFDASGNLRGSES